MDLKEISINTKTYIHLAELRDCWRALVKAGIEPPGSISHAVMYFVFPLLGASCIPITKLLY